MQLQLTATTRLLGLAVLLALATSSLAAGSAVSAVSAALSQQQAEQPNSWPNALGAATLFLYENYLSRTQSTAIIVEMCHLCNYLLHQQQHDLLSHVLQGRTNAMPLGLLLFEGMTSGQPATHHIFIVDSVRSFRTLRFEYADAFDKEFFFLIVLTWQTDDERARVSAIHDIFIACLEVQVLNAVVLAADNSGAVLFYNYALYAPNCDQHISVIHFNTFVDGQLKERVNYNPRIISLFGCPLNVSWYSLAPFVMFNGDENNHSHLAQPERISGIDGELLKVLAEIFNFRIQLLPPCKKSFISPNGTVTGCFSSLETGESYISIGALSGSHGLRHKFSTTCAYHQSALVFVVRLDRYFGPMSLLVAPFAGYVWLCILATCALLLLLLQWLQQGRCNAICNLLSLLTTLLGNPVATQSLPAPLKVRLVVMAWLLLTLVLRGVYVGQLFDVFREPCWAPLPLDLGQLLAQNYTLLASEYTDFFPAERTLLVPTTYEERFARLEQTELPRLLSTALLGNLAHYKYVNWEQSRLIAVPQSIYMYQLVMYMRRHSIFKFEFDRKIKQLMAGGFVGYLTRAFELRKYGALSVMPEDQYMKGSLQLDMIAGLYYVYLLMLLAALLVFALELLSLRVQSLRRCFL